MTITTTQDPLAATVASIRARLGRRRVISQQEAEDIISEIAPGETRPIAHWLASPLSSNPTVWTPFGDGQTMRRGAQVGDPLIIMVPHWLPLEPNQKALVLRVREVRP